MKFSKILALAPLFLLAIGCNSGARVSAPDGFAELDEGEDVH